jgi:tRNA A37 threonylcarbamoyltransferase TsaD
MQGSSSNKVFSDPQRSREEYILGIESSFDESAASLVNSYGEVIANHQITQWEQWNEFDGVVPEVAKENHEINIPKVTK